MKNVFPLIALSATLLLQSCQTKETPTQESVYKDVVLKLDDGEKWKVPQEMAIYIDSSIQLIESSKSIDKDLSTSLSRQKDGFVSNCSMKGEGHDVLHAWLIPYLGLLDDLSTTETAEEKEHLFREIETAKELYLEYFD